MRHDLVIHETDAARIDVCVAAKCVIDPGGVVCFLAWSIEEPISSRIADTALIQLNGQFFE